MSSNANAMLCYPSRLLTSRWMVAIDDFPTMDTHLECVVSAEHAPCDSVVVRVFSDDDVNAMDNTLRKSVVSPSMVVLS